MKTVRPPVVRALLGLVILSVLASPASAAKRHKARSARPTVARPLPLPTDDSAFEFNRNLPLDLRIVNTERKDGFTYQSLTYSSPKGGRVVGALLIPDGAGSFPAVLMLHGFPGSYLALMPEGEDLARHGAVVLLIDAPFSRSGRSGNLLTFGEQDRRDQVQVIVDLRRALDFLSTRRDVDPQRIGFVGVSYGGAMGGLLAGVEKRIHAYALVVGEGGFVSHFTGPDDVNGPLQRLSPEQAKRWLAMMEPIEPVRFVGRAAPAHLLFQNGRQDNIILPADGKAFQEAGSEPKTVLWYDGDHNLNEQAVYDRHLWLAQELGMRPPEPPAKKRAPVR